MIWKILLITVITTVVYSAPMILVRPHRPQPYRSTPLPNQLSYERDIKPIFKARCVNCHSPDLRLPNVLNYDSVYKYRLQIRERVWVNRTMPLGEYMPTDEREKIKDWIDKGANR